MANPVDMIAAATAADYERALEAVVGDPGVDSVIAIFVRPLATRAADVVAAIRAVGASPRAVTRRFSPSSSGPDAPANVEEGVPLFGSVEEAARALAHATRYSRHRSAPPDPPAPTPAVEGDEVAAMIADALAAGGGWMSPAAAEALLRGIGLPVIESRSAATPHDVRRAARGARRPGGAQGDRSRPAAQVRRGRGATRPHGGRRRARRGRDANVAEGGRYGP